MLGEVKCAVRKWFKKENTNFCKDGFQKLVQRWPKCIEVLVILWKNNYAAMQIIDVDIFLFYFIKISIPPSFSNLSGGYTYQPVLVI